LNALLESRELRERTKAAALQAAQRTFHWEAQEKALHEEVARALRQPNRFNRHSDTATASTAATT
jgi:hypothetical protein